MSTIENSPVPIGTGDPRLIVFGIVLTVASSLLAGWLLFSGDIPTGLASLLLLGAGIMFVALGTKSSPPDVSA